MTLPKPKDRGLPTSDFFITFIYAYGSLLESWSVGLKPIKRGMLGDLYYGLEAVTRSAIKHEEKSGENCQKAMKRKVRLRDSPLGLELQEVGDDLDGTDVDNPNIGRWSTCEMSGVITNILIA